MTCRLGPYCWFVSCLQCAFTCLALWPLLSCCFCMFSCIGCITARSTRLHHSSNRYFPPPLWWSSVCLQQEKSCHVSYRLPRWLVECGTCQLGLRLIDWVCVHMVCQTIPNTAQIQHWYDTTLVTSWITSARRADSHPFSQPSSVGLYGLFHCFNDLEFHFVAAHFDAFPTRKCGGSVIGCHIGSIGLRSLEWSTTNHPQ